MIHDHPHAHPASADSDRMLMLATALTLGFAGIEAAVGLWAGSLALVADAGHMVNDAAALALAAGAAWLARRGASARHSYGLGRAEFLAALINSAALLALVVWLVISAITRLHTSQAVQGVAVSLTAALGLALNLAVAWMLTRGEETLNTRAALLHVLGDLLGSMAALSSGLIIAVSGWTPIDPLLSLAIGALILVSSLRLLRESVHGLMEGVPLHLDLARVGQALAAVPGVASVHDLHIWAVRSDLPVLTAHLVVPDLAAWEEILEQSHALLRHDFGITHVTLQPEPMTRRVRWGAPSPLGAHGATAATPAERSSRACPPPAAG
ncbi:cation diffusion facilitator family transporter [Thermochromatium tepidum]|uniref:Cation diffusion facilitator family transporter n=1 Tax=Thermochromatium tepidum ATCC 43061 TaxID=316276 RepID=A0A6I6E3D6_THETI|nr:cation diffusion facilitator family transporter [Thermochromatium tepidum]QGU32262.1 cation diffusion facilitator family transporter [Thermochromatium tepidum ATCC 43061]